MPKRGAKCAYPDSLWKYPIDQRVTSARTSRHQVPAVFQPSHGKWTNFKRGTKNAYIGGGAYDDATNHLKKMGVRNYIYDPYNRTIHHNAGIVDRIRCGQSHTATVSNVLNVIGEAKVRQQVIKQAADAVGCDGEAYFYMYEGNGKGKAGPTRDGWQENRKARTYVPEIAKVFSDVEGPTGKKGLLIIARSPKTICKARKK